MTTGVEASSLMISTSLLAISRYPSFRPTVDTDAIDASVIAPSVIATLISLSSTFKIFERAKY